MTSFLEVDYADESRARLASRKSVIAAHTRIDHQFGEWLRQATTAEQLRERLDYIAEDVSSYVYAACDEYGSPEDAQAIYDTVMDYFEARFTEQHGDKTSSVHESRKPKMCPFHKDVVDISLAAGDARAGFDSMAQHWGGPRHCEGEGYEGSNCNFKPQMVTQSWWDERAEKAEQRRKERAEQAEFEALDPEVPVEDEPVAETDSPVETIEPASEGGEVIEFPSEAQDAPVEEPQAEVPMSMAAKTADAAVPTMDKRKWTPQTVPFLDVDDDDGPNPTRHKDIIEPIIPNNQDKFTEIGEQVTEHQDVAEDTGPEPKETGTFPKGNQVDPVTSAKIPDDVDKNPITALVQGEYDGFLPANEVQQAIASIRQ